MIQFFKDRALVIISVGDWTLSLGLWIQPGFEWGRNGYDCLWRTWAVYPLFDLEQFDPYKYYEHAINNFDKYP